MLILDRIHRGSKCSSCRRVSDFCVTVRVDDLQSPPTCVKCLVDQIRGRRVRLIYPVLLNRTLETSPPARRDVVRYP